MHRKSVEHNQQHCWMLAFIASSMLAEAVVAAGIFPKPTEILLMYRVTVGKSICRTEYM